MFARENTVSFQNPHTGEIRTVKAGWSWILFLFSGFWGVPLFLRRLYYWGSGFVFLNGLYLTAVVVPAYRGETTSGLGIVFILGLLGLEIFLGLKGNEITAKNYLENGWSIREPDDPRTKHAAMNLGISSSVLWSAANPQHDSAAVKPLESGQATKEYMQCPFCAEDIVRGARICKHCKSEIPLPPEPSQAPAVALSLSAFVNKRPPPGSPGEALMKQHDIIFWAGTFQYYGHKYDKLEDAIKHATTGQPTEIGQPVAGAPADMEEFLLDDDIPVAPQTFHVILTGSRPDIPLAEVRQKLAALFKATPEQIDRILANTRYTVKKGLNENEATRYKNAIETAGGICRIEMEEPTQAVPPPLPTPLPPPLPSRSH